MKEKFIVLDVEGYSTARPYNIGYIVADNAGRIYRKRSFAFPETIWENIKELIRTRQAEEMTKANIEEILQDIKNKRRKRKYTITSIKTFEKIFLVDIKKYKISKMYAYNVNFDKNALGRLLGYIPELEYRDIISGILDARLKTKKYVDFCESRGYITEKGNIQTKAEVVYRYLTGCLDFVEEHTGLADVMIEYYILLTAFNSHTKINWSPRSAWRELNKIR